MEGQASGLAESAAQRYQQEPSFFPSFPGQPSWKYDSTLRPAPGQLQPLRVVHSDSTHSKQRPQLPWLQGKMQHSMGGPSGHICPFHGQTQITWPVLNQSLVRDVNQINPTVELGFSHMASQRRVDTCIKRRFY